MACNITQPHLNTFFIYFLFLPSFRSFLPLPLYPVLFYPSFGPMNKISFSRYRISSVFILQRETRREREQESVMENKRAIFLFIYLSGPSWPCRALTLCVMVRHQPNPSPFKKTILWLYSICLLQIWFYYEPRPHLFPAWLMSMHRPVLTLSLAHFSPLLFTLKLIDCLIRHLAAHGEFGYLYSSLEGSSSFPLLNISSR